MFEARNLRNSTCIALTRIIMGSKSCEQQLCIIHMPLRSQALFFRRNDGKYATVSQRLKKVFVQGDALPG